MIQTTIQVKRKVELRNPILVEGLPGLGSVGAIAISYMMKKLKARKFAELHSPFFPHHVIVDKDGNVRLLRAEFYFLKVTSGNDLILLTGDSQAQTINGQYEMVSKILDFVQEYGVRTIVTLGGYYAAGEGKKPRVICASTSPVLQIKMLKAGAIPSPTGNPIVGAAGLFLGLTRLRGIDAVCLLGETTSYVPDPRAAKSVLMVLRRVLGVKIDLNGLDEAIKKSEGVVKSVAEIQKRMEALERASREREEGKITYIS